MFNGCLRASDVCLEMFFGDESPQSTLPCSALRKAVHFPECFHLSSLARRRAIQLKRDGDKLVHTTITQRTSIRSTASVAHHHSVAAASSEAVRDKVQRRLQPEDLTDETENSLPPRPYMSRSRFKIVYVSPKSYFNHLGSTTGLAFDSAEVNIDRLHREVGRMDEGTSIRHEGPGASLQPKQNDLEIK